MNAVKSGYNATSIVFHWLTFIAVVALFFTHEGDGLARSFHVGGGALIGIFLLWRVFRRIRLGMTEKPSQAAILNLLSSIVLWGLLATIFVVVVTGYLLPWTRGQALDFFGMVSIPSPMAASRDLHEFVEEVHDLAGHLFIPLVALHILGALKHRFFDRDDTLARMVRPVAGGR